MIVVVTMLRNNRCTEQRPAPPTWQSFNPTPTHVIRWRRTYQRGRGGVRYHDNGMGTRGTMGWGDVGVRNRNVGTRNGNVGTRNGIVGMRIGNVGTRNGNVGIRRSRGRRTMEVYGITSRRTVGYENRWRC